MKKVCMLGSGAFGTAISALLADNGLQVNMWCFDPAVAKSVELENCNKFCFPDVTLNKNIKAFTDMAQAMDGCEIIFEATPIGFLRSVLQNAKPYYNENQTWVVLSKGIENDTLLFPSQMLDDIFKKDVKKAVISGPSFAKDIIAKQLTVVDIASHDQELVQNISKLLCNNYFKTFWTCDMLGLQAGGALKNIVALAIGMLDGAGYADNTKAFLLHACLQEMIVFANIIGAQKQTLYGLSGMGDLVLTCMGSLSRNLKMGRLLGKGNRLSDIVSKTGINSDGSVAEGINTIASVYKMISDNGACDMFPLFCMIHAIVFEDKSVSDLVSVLIQN